MALLITVLISQLTALIRTSGGKMPLRAALLIDASGLIQKWWQVQECQSFCVNDFLPIRFSDC